jgi:hypothetical protein
MREYLSHRQSYLFEIIRLEAPPSDRKCTKCKHGAGTIRCRDCCHAHFYCTSCCLSIHAVQPYHRIQRFNGHYFEKCDLDELGLAIDIRPHTGGCVYNPSSGQAHRGVHSEDESDWGDDDETIGPEQGDFHSIPNIQITHQGIGVRRMVIISSMGICKRSVQFCTCSNAPKKDIQLLRCRLFPATATIPSTAFTFEVLDHFRLDSLECNTAAMKFMTKLTRMTNEIYPSKVPVWCLSSFVLTTC